MSSRSLFGRLIVVVVVVAAVVVVVVSGLPFLEYCFAAAPCFKTCFFLRGRSVVVIGWYYFFVAVDRPDADDDVRDNDNGDDGDDDDGDDSSNGDDDDDVLPPASWSATAGSGLTASSPRSRNDRQAVQPPDGSTTTTTRLISELRSDEADECRSSPFVVPGRPPPGSPPRMISEAPGAVLCVVQPLGLEPLRAVLALALGMPLLGDEHW